MRPITRRQACLALPLGPSAFAARAQAFPTRPLRLIIPFPGGFTDTLARLVGQKMSEFLGQPVVVEQKPGGSGQIGAAEALRAPADGHTLFLIHIGTHAINPALFSRLSYDAEKDFIPVTELVRVPNLLVASPTLGINSVAELVAMAKAKPQTLFFASPGNGSSGHLAGELFKSSAQVQVTHVPYKGTSETVQDLVSGRVHFSFDTLAQGAALAQGGKVKALAVTSARRHPSFPDIPTMAESGFPGWETGPWFGLAVRQGTPPDAVRRLHAEASKALQAADVRDKLLAMGSTPVGDRPEQFAAFIRAEAHRWGDVVRTLGLKAE